MSHDDCGTAASGYGHIDPQNTVLDSSYLEGAKYEGGKAVIHFQISKSMLRVEHRREIFVGIK